MRVPIYVIEDDEGRLFPVIAGGDGTGEGTGGEPEGSENLDAGGAGGEGAGGEGGDGGEGKEQAVPYARFREVNAELKKLKDSMAAYSEFGDPAEIKASLARLKELSEKSPYTEKEQAAIEERLKAIPAFKRVLDYIENQTRSGEENSQAFLKSMRNETANYMKELGLEIKDEAQRKKVQIQIEAVLAETIRIDPELMRRWKAADKTVIKDAIKESQAVLGLIRRNTNSKIQGNKVPFKPAAPKPPGSPPIQEGPKDPRDVEREILDKAADKGFQILLDREAS